jgi:tight adherence protein B
MNAAYYYALLAAAGMFIFFVLMSGHGTRRYFVTRRNELLRRLGAQRQGESDLYGVGDSRVHRFLAEAGLAWKPRDLLTRSLLAMSGSILVGAVFAHAAGALLGAIAGALAFPLWVAGKRSSRMARCDEQMPQALQLMILALRAGHALPGALALAARETPKPLKVELEQATQEHNLGRPIAEVILNVARRLPTSDTAQTLSVAVAVLAQTGGNLIGVMDRIVENSRARTQYRAKLSALTAQGRWSAWILCGMPFGFAFMAAMLDPNYVPAVLAHPFLIILFFGLWTPGLLWTLKLVRSAGASG